MRRSNPMMLAAAMYALLWAATAHAQPVTEEPVNVFVSTSTQSNQMDITAFTVPTGKRLIIEYISLRARVPAGQTVTEFFMNRPHVHFFVVSKQGTDISGRDVFTAAQDARIILKAGDTIVFRAQRNAFGNTAFLDAAFAGKMVPE